MVYHKPESVLENETQIQLNHLFPARRPDSKKNQQKKNRRCRIEDFTIPADHRGKIKENGKRGKLHGLWLRAEQAEEYDPIYPAPPLGQDMTHGQFLSGV